ncbi:MAG: hypothetical protein MJZ20_09080 [Bacteroidaceae bacterium]|nr:hypothetical protein [Bacteroidaceae bacterium]
MKKILHIALMLLYICVAASIPCGQCRAQITVDATLDSTQIFIGQNVGLTLHVSVDADKEVTFPQYDSLQQIVPGVEVVNCSDVDTEYINEGKRLVLSRKYIITSFDTALYYLPPMQIKVDTTIHFSKNLALKVLTFDIDTTHVDSLFPFKEIMNPAYSFEDWKPLMYWSIVIAILALILTYIIVRIKENKPIIRRIKLRPRIAPHKLAMQKIEQIKQDELAKSNDPKFYYTELTDTLRQYISERFGFQAMEMTTDEIISHLEETEDKTAISELHELFMTADLVKFAKYVTEFNENDRNLLTAVDYINQTKLEDVKPQPTEIVVEEKRSKTTKIVLNITVTVISLALLVALAYCTYKIILMTL